MEFEVEFGEAGGRAVDKGPFGALGVDATLGGAAGVVDRNVDLAVARIAGREFADEGTGRFEDVSDAEGGVFDGEVARRGIVEGDAAWGSDGSVFFAIFEVAFAGLLGEVAGGGVVLGDVRREPAGADGVGDPDVAGGVEGDCFGSGEGAGDGGVRGGLAGDLGVELAGGGGGGRGGEEPERPRHRDGGGEGDGPGAQPAEARRASAASGPGVGRAG